jgi:hypothetical protein
MTNQKSTPIIVLGVAVFIVAGALLFVLLRHHGHKKTPAAATAAAAATTTLPPGTKAFTATPATVPPEIQIPAGKNGLAVQMQYFPGVGGYVHSGDQINVYAIVNKACTDPKFPLAVKLSLSNVKVLSVLGSPPAATGQPGSFLLAVTPQQAEQLIFTQTLGQLYFTLTGGNSPAATTTGVTCSSVQ